MTPTATPVTYGLDASIARFSVARYQRMIEAGILTPDGHGLVAGIYILHHAATIDFFVQRILREWPRDDIREGDMFFTNDPEFGALHSNDGILVTPIFHGGGSFMVS